MKALDFLKCMRKDTPCEWTELDEAIAELEEAMKPKTCNTCIYAKTTLNQVVICGKNGTYKETDDYCKYHEPKDNA